MRKLSFDIEDRMKTIGWYQILGGFFGIIMTIYVLFHTGSLDGAVLLFFSLAIILFSFSIYCGNLLRTTDVRGLKLSTWNQALQVIQFGVWAIGFEYYSGVRLAFGFDWGEIFLTKIFLSLSSVHLRYTPDNTSHLSFWINFVPIIIIYLIDKIENEIEERKIIVETTLKLVNEQNNSDEKSMNT